MPQVVAGGIIKAFGLKGFGAFVAQVLVSAAFYAAANRYQKRQLKKLRNKEEFNSGRTVIVRETLHPYNVIYGETWVGGLIAYANVDQTTSSGDQNELFYAIVHCAHEVESIVNYMYDNETVFGDGTTIVDGTSDHIVTGKSLFAVDLNASPVRWSVEIESHFGTDSQAVSSVLSSAFPSDFTANHRGRGKCYSVHRLTIFPSLPWVFEAGPPGSMLALIKGRKIYDPRKDGTNGGSGSHRYTDSTTWEYSTNPILCAVDFLANWARKRIPYTGFNWTVIAAEADICDELVSSPSDESPQVAKRYECNGSITLGQEDAENLDAILSSCMGWLSKKAGKWCVYAGSYKTPTISLTINHIVGEVTVTTSTSRKERYNGVRGTYFDNDDFAQFKDFPSLQDSSFLARDNDEELWQDIDLLLTSDVYQAQRIAYKHLQQSDLMQVAIVPLNWYGLNISPGDTVQLTYAPFGWSNKVFKCENWQLGTENAPIVVTLREETSGAWADPDLSDYRTISAAGVITDNPVEVLPPTNLAANVSDSGGVLVTWSLPETVRIDFVRLYASTDSSWSNASVVFAGFANGFLHQVTEPYYYWVRSVYRGEESDREPDSDTSTITASYNIVNVWQSRTAAAPAGWRSICWSPELDLFCAVGYSTGGSPVSIVQTSPDGETWTKRNQAVTYDFNSICWSPELTLFCAVAQSGTGNRVMTSPDGTNWTARSSAADNSWKSVCWAASTGGSPNTGLFVAVASDGSASPSTDRVMTSPDGINWTIRTAASTAQWTSVTFAPELNLFVAVGVENGSTENVMTSPDGINWTLRDGANTNWWNSVCWSPLRRLFVAVAYNPSSNRIMSSPDGVTWTARASVFETGVWTSVTWAEERKLFVAVSSMSVGHIGVMTSPDGFNWSGHTIPRNTWQSVAFSPSLNKFCVVGSNDPLAQGRVATLAA